MYLIYTLLTLIALLWAIDRYWLRGGPQPEYRESDNPDLRQTFGSQPQFAEKLQHVEQQIQELNQKVLEKIRLKDIPGARKVVDSLSDGRHYASDFIPVQANGVKAEWVLAEQSDNSRRLLFIHGGGFKFGSPKSHRTITSNFAEMAGCAVLSIDYRMLPEHQFNDAVKDCRTAYQWLLNNGPDGSSEADQMFVAGDSAGGNLALSLIAWLRDEKIRPPDAVIAMSPLTDATLSGKTVRSNESSDIMLKHVIAPLNRLPNAVRPWVIAFINRARPASPVVSPLFGDLSNLPPLLLQASESEMLLDDSKRYFDKACAAGSQVQLQTWADVMHVWQLFDPELPQAHQAWQEIRQFIALHSRTQVPANALE